jgi:hypothetical protein
MVMWGGMGLLALNGAYYASDSAQRWFYAGLWLIWLDICDDVQASNFERNWPLAGIEIAQIAIEFIVNRCAAEVMNRIGGGLRSQLATLKTGQGQHGPCHLAAHGRGRNCVRCH